MPSFAHRLKELRNAKGETQKQIADLLNIAERNYRRYEAGDVDPSASNASILAEHFEVSVDYLLGRTNYWVGKDGHIKVKTYDHILNIDVEELKGLLDNNSRESE